MVPNGNIVDSGIVIHSLSFRLYVLFCTGLQLIFDKHFPLHNLPRWQKITKKWEMEITGLWISSRTAGHKKKKNAAWQEVEQGGGWGA